MTIGSIFNQVAVHMPDLLQARLVAKNGVKERKDHKERMGWHALQDGRDALGVPGTHGMQG